MTGIDAELLSRFRDDDTDTWIAAAIEMGEKGPAVLPELESYLSSEKDMHAHRHTWGVMAAVLSTHWDREIPRIPMVTRPGLAPERIEPRVWFKNLAQETVIAGLAAEGSATFGDLANLDVFVRKRDGRIAKARANADRAPEHAREAARDKADRQIAALRDPATPIRGSVLSLKGRLEVARLPCEQLHRKRGEINRMLNEGAGMEREYAQGIKQKLEAGENPPSEVEVRVYTLWLTDEIAVVGIQAEPLIGMGAHVEKSVAPARCLFLGYTNGCVGYLPDTTELKRGGYEQTSYLYNGWSGPFRAGLEKVVAGAVWRK